MTISLIFLCGKMNILWKDAYFTNVLDGKISISLILALISIHQNNISDI